VSKLKETNGIDMPYYKQMAYINNKRNNHKTDMPNYIQIAYLSKREREFARKMQLHIGREWTINNGHSLKSLTYQLLMR
jgi:hypothetical protein